MATNDKALPKEIQIALSAAEQVKERAKIAQEEADLETESKQKTLTALGALSGLGGTQSDLQSQVLQALLENLQHDMQKKRAKEKEEEDNVRRLMQARNDSLKIERAQREHTQRVCDHRKENGHSRICGQKLSNNSLSLMCNLCYRQFDENNVPPHLMISGEFIGG